MHKYLIIGLIFLTPSAVNAWDHYNRKLPFSGITLAGAKPGMAVEHYKSQRPEAEFKPVEQDGVLHHYEFNYRQKDEDGVLTERFFAGVDGIIYKLERAKEYSKALNAVNVAVQLHENYGYEDVRSNTGTFSNIYCWYGCETTTTGSTDFLRVYTHAPQFLVEVAGYSKFHIKNDYEIPEKGLISFTLNHGELEQRNEKVWLAKIEEIQKTKPKEKAIEDEVGKLFK